MNRTTDDLVRHLVAQGFSSIVILEREGGTRPITHEEMPPRPAKTPVEGEAAKLIAEALRDLTGEDDEDIRWVTADTFQMPNPPEEVEVADGANVPA